VEDDEGVRASVEQVLTQCGYQLLVAADGAEALRLARRHQGAIHLLLLDMVMPGKNGQEVAQQIAPLHPQAKVLFISGYGPRGQEEAPDSRIFRKPFTGGALARKVRETLDAGARQVEGCGAGNRREMEKPGKCSPRRKSC
jgi:two-component system cell cycle sensor histidine kinase/response regulator CckA